MKIGRRIEAEGRPVTDVIEQRIPGGGPLRPVPGRIEQEMRLEASCCPDREIVGRRVPALSGDVRIGDDVPGAVEHAAAQDQVARPGPSDPKKKPDENRRARRISSHLAPLQRTRAPLQIPVTCAQACRPGGPNHCMPPSGCADTPDPYAVNCPDRSQVVGTRTRHDRCVLLVRTWRLFRSDKVLR